MTVTHLNNTQPGHMTGPEGYTTGMLPLYYIPTTHQRSMQTQYADPSFTPSGFQGEFLPQVT